MKSDIDDFFKNKRALICDDLVEARANLRRCLEGFGVPVIDIALSGENAAELLSENNYDIVLCDYNLGKGKDGQQVLEEARFAERIKESTVYIMVTAENTKEMVMGALEYQPDNYLTKPYTPDELKTRITRVARIKSEMKNINAALDMKEYDQATVACDELIAKNPSYEWICLRKKGQALLDSKQYALAAAVYQDVVDRKGLPWAILGLGKAYYYLKNYEKAEKHLIELTNTNKAYVQGLDWLSKVYKARGESEQAQKTLETAIEQSPKAVQRQLALGDIAKENNDHETAAKAFKNTIKLAQNSCFKSADNYKNYAKALQTTIKDMKGTKEGRMATEEAIRAMEQMKDEYQSDLNIRLDAAVINTETYTNVGKQELAKKCMEEAGKIYKKIDEHKTENHLNMASGYNMTEETEKACEMLNKVDEADVPTHLKETYDTVQQNIKEASMAASETLNNEAVKSFQAGDIDKAISVLKDALNYSNTSLNLQLNAAQIFITHMEKSGKDQELLAKAGHCLSVAVLDPSDEKRKKRRDALMQKFKALGGII